jgi:5'-phosphate synthase pdxT subunit
MIGVLALQGDFEAHAQVLRGLGVPVREVRRVAQLADLQALVLPGGESTTLLHLMADEPWFPALRALHARGGALLGTCAGAILLAREVRSPSQPSLGLLDVAIERNAYGRQVDSFETALPAPALGGALSGVFIRAPRFRALGAGVTVLATLGGEPVLVRQDRVLAGTFHPELAGEPRLHRYFLDMTAATVG